MKRKLRVGIIGVGMIAEACHIPGWRIMADEGRADVVALCDLDQPRLERIATALGGAATYTDYRRMLRDAELDIVDICTHNRLHAPMTVASLAAGCHVLVEKPMAMSVREAGKMMDAADKAKRKLMVAQHFRFEPNARKVHEVVQAGELGEIYHARASWRRRRGIPGWGVFIKKKESLGGPLIDIGVHVMDLAYWLSGCPRPVSVSGQVYRKFGDRKDLVPPPAYRSSDYDVEDYATAFVRFENGLTVNLEACWAANVPEGEKWDVELLGDKGGARVFPPVITGYDRDALTTRTYDTLPPGGGHAMEIRHFTECVEKDKPVLVQPSQSLAVQKIINGIYDSARKGREVRLK